jgi:hypothetical protein
LTPRLGKLAFDEANTLLRDASRSLRAYRATEVMPEMLAFLAGTTDRHFTTLDAIRRKL